jgi:drug/metabolite transporter (DMT)-like permease
MRLGPRQVGVALSAARPLLVLPANQLLGGILLLLGAVSCFAGMDATAKWINQTNDPMLTAAGLPRTNSLPLQCGRAVCLVAATITSFFAYRHLPLTQATAITFASPLIVAIIAGPMLGEWPGRHRLGAVAAGFAGVLIVTRPWSGHLQPAVALAFLTAVLNAVYSVTTRILATRDRALTTLFYTGVVGSAVMLPVLPFAGPYPGSPVIWLAMLLLGALGALGHWLLIMAHDRASPSTLAPFFYAQLLGAAVMGWLMFGEVPNRWTVAGGAVIVASGLYLLFRERMQKRQA